MASATVTVFPRWGRRQTFEADELRVEDGLLLLFWTGPSVFYLSFPVTGLRRWHVKFHVAPDTVEETNDEAG